MSPPPSAPGQGICQIRETFEKAAAIGGFFTIWGLCDLEQSPPDDLRRRLDTSRLGYSLRTVKPTRHNNRGSLVVALSLPGLFEKPQVRRATGTKDKGEFYELAAWLSGLYRDDQNHGYLRKILLPPGEKKKQKSEGEYPDLRPLVDIWRTAKARQTGNLALEVEPPLLHLLRLWFDRVRLSPSTQRDRLRWLKPDPENEEAGDTRQQGILVTGFDDHTPLSALRDRLDLLRQGTISEFPWGNRVGKRKGSVSRYEFLRARTAVLAFYRDLPLHNPNVPKGLGRRLHESVLEISVSGEEFARETRPMAPNRWRDLAERMGAPFGGYIWALLVTGMNPKEYFGEPLTAAEFHRNRRDPIGPAWFVADGLLHIEGTKRKARRRTIPLVWPEMPVPEHNYNQFAKAFRESQRDLSEHEQRQPYDLRRSFASGCSIAGITRARRMYYTGHAAQDVQDKYEREHLEQEPEKRIADAEALRLYFGPPPGVPQR